MVDDKSGAVREAGLQPYADTEVVRYTLAPRSTVGPFPAHEPGTREGFVVLSGRIAVTAGETTLELAAGDAAALLADCAHQISNPNDVEAALFSY